MDQPTPNNPNAKIAYCVDIIPERARALAGKFGDTDTMAITDYHDLLQDPEVEVGFCRRAQLPARTHLN